MALNALVAASSSASNVVCAIVHGGCGVVVVGFD